MAEIRLQASDLFNFKTPDKWPKWRKRFQQFRVASALDRGVAAKQVNTLLHCMGEEFEALMDSMNVNDEEKQDYAVVLVQFDDFFNVRRNIIFEPARFNCRSQQEGETADEFIMELYKLIEDCNYGGLQDEVIGDRLVVGIRYQTLLEKMQLDPDLNLEKAKKMAGQQEAICDQSHKLKKEEGAIVDAVSSR